jgi:hypothetical protein
MGVTRETASQEQLMRATTLANENAFKASESAEERKLKMDLQREANAHAESILKLKDELEKDKAFEDLGIDPKELKGLSEDKKLSFIAHRYQALRQGKDQGQVKFDNTITGINAGANAVNTATGIFK